MKYSAHLIHWSNLQTFEWFFGRAAKSGIGLIISWIQTCCSRFTLVLLFYVKNWRNVLFTDPLMTAPNYIKLRLIVDIVDFQRTYWFYWLWRSVLVNFNWIQVFRLQFLFIIHFDCSVCPIKGPNDFLKSCQWTCFLHLVVT